MLTPNDLTFETLARVQKGGVCKAVNIELEKIRVDIGRRQGDDRKRILTLVMEFKPQPNLSTGKVEDTEFTYKTATKLPGQEGKSLLRFVGETGEESPRLLFASDSPDNPDQMGFSDLKDGGVDELTRLGRRLGSTHWNKIMQTQEAGKTNDKDGEVDEDTGEVLPKPIRMVGGGK
jgi:hypothetical protein